MLPHVFGQVAQRYLKLEAGLAHCPRLIPGPLSPPADARAALRVLGGERPLGGPAEPEGEEVHHAGVPPPLPHPGHQVAALRRLPGGGLLRRLRLRLADGHR